MSWIDRVVEFPNRVKLTAVTGQDNVYDIEANEGTIYVEGTLLNAENLNTETQAIAQNAVESQSDYIIESGEIDNWHYTKYASGKCEARRLINESGAFSGTLINNWYVKNLNYRVPSFMTPITVIANGKWGSGYSWVNVRNIDHVANGSFELEFFKNNAVADTAFASVYAYGTWS